MAHGHTARLFVAVDPPTIVCDELLAWTRSAVAKMSLQWPSAGPAPLRLLEPEALHVTLCFLGARPVGEIETIGAVLSASARHVGELFLGVPLWLPPRRPRALAVEIQDRAAELARLQAAVREAVAGATGWEGERRGFRGHITVARMRGRAAQRRSPQADDALPATPQLSFTPSSVVLYRSWLSRAGATYEALASCELPSLEP
jgi:2'-5' RNA ligase